MITAEEARLNKPKNVVKSERKNKKIILELSRRIEKASLNDKDVYFDHEDEKVFKDIIELLKSKGFEIEETGLEGTVKVVWEKKKE